MNTNQMNGQTRQMGHCCDPNQTSLGRKYLVLCLICGILTSVVGSIIMIIYALIRSNTSTLQHLETFPTYIPGCLLIINGLVVMVLAKNQLRFVLLIKLIGFFYLICALLCVVMTVTTSIIHMNRLQNYGECSPFPNVNDTCVCVPKNDNKSNVVQGHPLVFENVPNCGLIEGLIFPCLRALFLLSVVAILICIFTLMLVYQLLSHQKKKKYLQQLEIRRRFHIQNRVFGCHSGHPSYLSSHISHVSPHISGQNRNSSLRYMTYGYCDDIIANGWTLPPNSYDNLDSRLNNRNLEEDIQSTNGITSNRSHSWTNWLNWSRNQVSASNHLIPNQSTNRRFLNFFRRNSNNNEDNQNGWRHPRSQTFLPPHVFIPRIGSGGLTGLPPHLTRYRDTHFRPTLLTPINSSYRRTRSNDGIFQHMTAHSYAIDQSSYTPNTSGPTNAFALWGPPPPYTCSQPQSLNRINTICNNMSHSSVSQHCRESSVHSTDGTPASKMSTPLSERRLRCNAFSSEGIRLNIEGNDNLKHESKGSCIVEIHVPFSEEEHNHTTSDLEDVKNSGKKSKLSFNTMPSMKRNEQHLQAINGFKSLSNIAISFPNGFKFDNKSEISDSEIQSNKSRVEVIQNVFCSQTFQPKSSMSSSLNSTSNTTSELTSHLSTFANTDVSFTANSFPVDPPTDYKSTLVIKSLNTSSLLTDNTSNNVAQRQVIGEKDIRLNSTQSMPNLSCIIPVLSSQSTSSRTQPNLWELHRIPSSGDTSTSQDLADYELELDEESIKFVADLPNDCPNKAKPVSNSFESSKSSSQTDSITPELIKPPTPFNNQDYTDNTTTSTATLSLSDTKPELIINIRGIQV